MHRGDLSCTVRASERVAKLQSDLRGLGLSVGLKQRRRTVLLCHKRDALIACPTEFTYRTIDLGGPALGLAGPSPIGLAIDDHQVPFVRFVAGSCLRLVSHLRAAGAELRIAVGCGIALGQGLPVALRVAQINSTKIVIGRPTFPLGRHRRDDQIATIGSETKIVPRAERHASRISIPIPRSHVAALGPIGLDHKDMLPLVLDVRIPVAIKESGKNLGFHQTRGGLFVCFLVLCIRLSKRQLAELGSNRRYECDLLAIRGPDSCRCSGRYASELSGFA